MQYIRGKFRYLFIIGVCFAAINFSGCKNGNQKALERTEVLLGTPCTVKIYDKSTEAVLDKVFDRLRQIEDRMSVNKDDSEVIRINKAAGTDYVKVSDDTFYVIKFGLKYGEISGGRFDITVGPLVKLWGIGTERARVPETAEIKEGISLINYRNVLLDESGKRVMLKNKNMALDLGGIAKGYAADEVSRILTENNVKHALINLGGNILTVGSKTNGEPWVIGVQNPDSTRGEYIGTVRVAGKTVVSSGDYERYLEHNGKRYHHIISTTTGYPVENELVSVTILIEKSIEADCLSTTLFAMGLQDGLEFAERNKLNVIFINKSKEVYTTSGLKEVFKMSDPSYKLRN